MKRFLGLISLLVLSVCAEAQHYVGKLMIEEGHTQTYQSYIIYKSNSLTGRCLLQSSGQQIIGSMVNEFGIKAMDFIYDTETSKVKLLNVVSFLNKWYIRKVLKADLSCMLGAHESKQDHYRKVTVQADGSISLENTKYKLKYNLSPLKDGTQE